MADTKISDLPAASDLVGATFPIVQSGATRKAGIALFTKETIGGLTTADSPQFAGLNVGHASDTTLARSSAGNLSVEGKLIYRADGTDVPLADGGTGASLTDPGADRIMFWDDSDGTVTWLSLGANLSITGTTLNASGGGSGGDDMEIVTASNPASPYTPTGLIGNTRIDVTGLDHNITINLPTGSTFGSGKEWMIVYRITASGGARTVAWGTGITAGLGAPPYLTIASGDTAIFVLRSTDSFASATYEGDLDISKLPTATPASGDFLLFSDASNGNALTRIGVLASDTAMGLVELATAAETSTGTDAARAVTPDGLAGSYAGTKAVCLKPNGAVGDDIVTGDGQDWFDVPAMLNGMNIVSVMATHATAGTTGTTDYQIRRVRSGTPVDVLSTKATIDSTETSTATAATAAVINTSNDDLATGDRIYLDVDAVSTTKPKGGCVTLEFRLP